MILAAVSSSAHGGQHFYCGATTGGSSGVETSRTHGQHLGGVCTLHSGNGITGVNGALEGIWAVNLGDIGNLAYIQLGGYAGGNVLARCGGSKQDVAVVAGHGQHLRGHVFSQAVGEAITFGMQHLGHTSDLRGGRSGCAGVVASHQHVHVATTLQCSSNGVQGCALDGCVVVFSDYEGSHENFL